MFRSNWGKGIALAGLVLSSPLQAQGQGYSAHHQANAAQGQQQVSAAPQPSAPPVKQRDVKGFAKPLKTANTGKETAEEKQQARENLQAQKDMAESAGRMFWVGVAESTLTFIGVILVALTLLATRRAAIAAENAVTETRRIGQAQVRAYLACKEATYIVAEDRLALSIELINTGQSPAKNIQVYARATVYPEEWKGMRETEMVVGRVPPIPSGEGGGTSINFVCKEGLDGKPFAASFYGLIRWEDVFDAVQTLGFSCEQIGTQRSVVGTAGAWREASLNITHKTPVEPDEDAWLADEIDQPPKNDS